MGGRGRGGELGSGECLFSLLKHPEQAVNKYLSARWGWLTGWLLGMHHLLVFRVGFMGRKVGNGS